MAMVVERFDVFLMNLAPTIEDDIQKSQYFLFKVEQPINDERLNLLESLNFLDTRPCVVISPNEMNRHIGTVIIAPITTKNRNYPTRIACQVQGKDGQIVLDQIRAIDKSQLIKRIGEISSDTQKAILSVLDEMFGE